MSDFGVEDDQELEVGNAADTDNINDESVVAGSEPGSEPGDLKADVDELRSVISRQSQMINNLYAAIQGTPRATDAREDDDLSIADDEVVSGADLKKVISKLSSKISEKEQKTKSTIDELSIANQYEDYKKVLSTYLPKVLKEHPDIADIIQGSKNPYLSAYRIAKIAQNGTTGQLNKTMNINRAKTVNSVKGASIGSVADFSNMNDSDFEKAVANIKAGRHI